LGGLGSGYIVLWDEPWPSDQTNLKRRSRCDVEMCCNVLCEGEGGWPLGQAGWPKGAGWPPLESSRSWSRSHAFSCLLESSSVRVQSI
jgi:hypothetical protein